jgi:O-antigen ligase
MTTLEHSRSMEQPLTLPSSIGADFRAMILLLLAGAIAVAGIVRGNYYLIAALPAACLLIRYPVETTLGLFAFLIPFDNLLLVGRSGFSVNWALGAVTGAALLAYGLMSGRLRAPSRGALWWGLFVLWGAATYLWALDPAQVKENLPTAVFLFLLYLVVTSFDVTPRELAAVVLFAIAGGVFASGYAMREFTQGIGWFSRAALVVSNHTSNPNDFADSLLLPFSLALGGFLSARTLFLRGGMLTAATIIGICELLTMSRGSLLALVALLLVYLMRLGVRRQVLIPIVLVSAFIVVAPSFFFERMQQAFTDRADGRWDILLVGTQVIKHYGILGIGLDNFRAGYAKFAGFAPVFRGFDRDPHNIYLQAWAELGVVGLILLFAAIGSHLKDLHLANQQARGGPNYLIVAIEAACWALMVHALGANSLWHKQFWLVWMLAALAVQLQRAALPQTQKERYPLAAKWYLQNI